MRSPSPSCFFPSPRAINCLTSTTSTTLEALVTCFDAYTVSQNYYDQSKYDAAQLTTIEKIAWTDAITSSCCGQQLRFNDPPGHTQWHLHHIPLH
jgi:hypothetical protein